MFGTVVFEEVMLSLRDALSLSFFFSGISIAAATRLDFEGDEEFGFKAAADPDELTPRRFISEL